MNKVKLLQKNVEAGRSILVEENQGLMEVRTPSDALYYDTLYSFPIEPSPLTMVVIAATPSFSERVSPLLSFLYVALTPYLESTFSVSNTSGLVSQFLKKQTFLTYLEEADSSISNKDKTPEYKEAVRYLKKFPTDKDNIEFMTNLVDSLKKKYYKTLTDLDKKVFLLFYKVYCFSELDEQSLKNLVIAVRYVEDNKVRMLVKGIKQTSMSFEGIRDEAKVTTKKLFGTNNPSQTQLETLAKKKPEEYKKWRKLLTELKKESKLQVEDYFIENNLKLVDVETARKICAELKVECPIDKGFKGKVALGDTPSVMFKYYTQFGKLINGTPGIDVRMNPDYDKSDSTYVCTSLPAGSFTNKRHKFYTLQFMKNSCSTNFASSRQVADVIEDCRAQFIEDMDNTDFKIQMYATLARLADLTCGRIGNAGSEKIGTYGLHNLLVKHITVKEGKATLEYVGKDHQDQKHVVTDPKMVEKIKKLVRGKKKLDYVFSKDGAKKVSPKNINVYLDRIGFPSTFHKFRKYHASRKFTEFKEAAKGKTQKSNVVTKFNKVVEEIANMLGNTPAVVVKSYIDPELTAQYFKEQGVEPPKSVKTALSKSHLAEDDDA